MDNKVGPLDIYLLGIGGTGMGAFAGLLKQKGHRVFGSDSAVYSPMKERLCQWGIKFLTPYDEKNLPTKCDLVIVGNVIRRDNPEAKAIALKNFSLDSFPSALNRFFLQDAVSVVASGTHGKTTCSALLAHTLYSAGFDPGFLIGGIPLNFDESFRVGGHQKPFVVEGDEYDTAYFDKRPKFIHYRPNYLLITSLEFDHGDIYRDLDAVIDAFVSLLKTLTRDDHVVINGLCPNIKTAFLRSQCAAKLITYGQESGVNAANYRLDEKGIYFSISLFGNDEDELFLPLFGEHNLMNALGCYALLRLYGLSHVAISEGFRTFLGVKRRLEEKRVAKTRIIIDDFAHHPSAVKETIKAARQKYPQKKVIAIFEPRSATTCMKIFEEHYKEAFSEADTVLLAPIGRDVLEKDRLNTEEIAKHLRQKGIFATAFTTYEDLTAALKKIDHKDLLLFMSNGDFKGLLKDIDKILF